MRYALWCFALVLAAPLAPLGGCAEDKVAHDLTSIGIVPNVQSLPAGYSQRYVALGSFKDGTSAALTDVVWESSNTAAVTIGLDGTAMGVAPGVSTLKATRGTIVGSLDLTVTDARLVSLGVDPPLTSLPIGVELQYMATGLFSDGTSLDLSASSLWSSSDTALVTIDVTGRAHALGAGAVTITANNGSVSGSATLNVTAARLMRLDIAPANPGPLPVGQTQAFTATGIYSDNHTVDLTASPLLTWSSSAPAVADLNHLQAGVFRGLALGVTMIHAAYDDTDRVLDATPVALAVTEAAITRIEVSESANVPVGFDTAFRATGFFSNGLVLDITDLVTWSTENQTIATISNALPTKGVAAGLAPGAVAIYARLGTLTGEGSLRVTNAHLVQLHVDPPTFDIEIGATRALVALGNFDDGSTIDLTQKVEWAVDPSDLDRAVFISNAMGREGLVTILPTALPSADPVTFWASYNAVTGRSMATIVHQRTLVGIVVSVDPGIVPIGLTAQATAIGLYSDGVHQPEGVDISERVTWSPVIGGIATVSNAPGTHGVVTGIASGEVEINACFGAVCANDPDGQGATYLARVTACGFDHVAVQPASVGIPRGTARQLTAHAFYAADETACAGLANASYDVTHLALWSSTNIGTATVSNALGMKGIVNANAVPTASEAEIRATYRDRAGNDLVGVAAIDVLDGCVDQITVTPAHPQLPVGVRHSFTATAHLTDGTTFDATSTVHWQVAGALALVGPGRIETFRPLAGFANTLTASFEGSASCASISGSVAVSINTKLLLTEVTIAPDAVTMPIGGSQMLVATGHYSDGEMYDITAQATWTSSNPAVVGVMPNGQIESYAAGTVVIVATYGHFSGIANIVSGGVALTGINVTMGPNRCGDFNGVGYPVGTRLPLVATGLWSNGTTQPLGTRVAWSSSDTDIARVDAFGIVTTVAAGTVTLTADKNGIKGTLVMHVLTTTLQSIDVQPGDGFVLPIRSSQVFHAIGYFDTIVSGLHRLEACDISYDVQWMAVPAASLAISASGRAISTGTPTDSALVTATRDGVVGSSHGIVSGSCIEGVRIVPSIMATAVGIATQYGAQALMSDGSTVDITYEDTLTWSSSNAQIATVMDGRATPIHSGTTYIYVTYYAGEAACPEEGPTFAAYARLDVGEATLTGIQVTCDGADTLWPSDSGDAPGLPAGIVTHCYAVGHYSDGTTANITTSAAWHSSLTTIAGVSDADNTKGHLTTFAAGSVQISAALGNIQGTVSLRVVGAMLSGITVYGPTALPVGFDDNYHAMGQFTIAPISHYYDLTALASWASNDAAYLRVSDALPTRGHADALVATSPGTKVNVTASYKGKTGLLPVAVLAVDLVSLDVYPRNIQLSLGQSEHYMAFGTFVDPIGGGAWDQDMTSRVTWRTTDPAVAIIDVSGTLSAMSVGDAIVSADYGNVSGSTGLRVKASCVDRLELSAQASVLPAGAPAVIRVNAVDSKGDSYDVTGLVAFQTGDPARMPAPDQSGWTYARRTALPGNVQIGATLNTGGCDGATYGTMVVTISSATLQQLYVVPAGFETVLPVGLERPFYAVGLFGDGMVYDLTRTVDAWTTGNPAVASVSNAPGHMGVVTGVGLGTTPIMATQGRISAQRFVTVVQETLESISVVGFDQRNACRSLADANAWIASDFREPVGHLTTWVRAIGHYSSGGARDITGGVTWSSSTMARAVVGNGATAGRVTTGDEPGMVRLSASTPTGMTSHIDMRVVDAAVERIAINPEGPDPLVLVVHNDAQLDVLGHFDGVPYCVTADASYVSSKGGTVRVSNASDRPGRVTGLAVGSGIVTALLGGVNDSILVEVGTATLTRVEVTPATLGLDVGETAQLRLLAYYDDGTINDVTFNDNTTWESDNYDIVATTATPGIILAAALGSANVDACLGFVCASDGNHDTHVVVSVP